MGLTIDLPRVEAQPLRRAHHQHQLLLRPRREARQAHAHRRLILLQLKQAARTLCLMHTQKAVFTQCSDRQIQNGALHLTGPEVQVPLLCSKCPPEVAAHPFADTSPAVPFMLQHFQTQADRNIVLGQQHMFLYDTA